MPNPFCLSLYPLHPKNHSTGTCDWPPAEKVAVLEYGEASPSDSSSKGPKLWRTVTWGDLRQRVAVLSTALRRVGCQPGDRIAHVSTNNSNPIVVFLACLAVGCVFSALPTDAGPQAMFSRLSQIRPRMVFTDDVTYYNGRTINVIDRVAQVINSLIASHKVDPQSSGPAQQVVCFANQRAGKTSEIRWKGTNAPW